MLNWSVGLRWSAGAPLNSSKCTRLPDFRTAFASKDAPWFCLLAKMLIGGRCWFWNGSMDLERSGSISRTPAGRGWDLLNAGRDARASRLRAAIAQITSGILGSASRESAIVWIGPLLVITRNPVSDASIAARFLLSVSCDNKTQPSGGSPDGSKIKTGMSPIWPDLRNALEI